MSRTTDDAPIDHSAVVVIGGGMAGLTALLAAAQAGANALLLERTDGLGGSTVMSGGMFTVAGSDEQASAGISDDPEALQSDLLEVGRYQNSKELVAAYCDLQLETYHWLKGLGVHFNAPVPGSGQSVERGHPIDTAAAIAILSREAARLGARQRLRTRARRLVIANDRVIGVDVRSETRPEWIAAGAVVIASGGFGRSEELISRFAPAMKATLRAGGPANTGDGLLMACKVGAGLADLPHVKGTFGIFPWRTPKAPDIRLLAIYKGAIAVNGLGHRFIDESRPYKEVGDACLAQPEGLAYQIFDEKVLSKADRSIIIYNFQRGIDGGQVRQADSIEALADELGIPGDVLAKTVRTYNERLVAEEDDDFGRKTLSGGVGVPFPLEHPPYFGFPTGVALLGTYAGITIDDQARVLDVFGEPIPGLYAAGEVTGGFHGGGYVSGTSIGKAAVFGRIAGSLAAADATSSPAQRP